jgi:hypothetical protein
MKEMMESGYTPTIRIQPPGPTPWVIRVADDPTSIHCAHTFFPYAWDRVINGRGYIHGTAGYNKSIPLNFQVEIGHYRISWCGEEQNAPRYSIQGFFV